jgi:hypothetical protein
MEKVLSLESSKDHYHANACIFWCFDDRLWRLRKEFIKKRGFKNVDVVQVAGGAKGLAEEGTPAQRFLLDQAAASVRLHHTDLFIPTLHIDCGAMGGSKAFGARSVEDEHHRATLEKIDAVLKREFPQVAVERYIPDFDGLHRA